MRRFFLFRTNLTNLESYHEINDLETFKLKCHDFYLLQSLWFLENDYFDEVIIWRLFNTKKEDIIFEINGKKFIQKWVNNFNEVFDYPTPDISLFRGGFKEYDDITKINSSFFGLKLYLAAGKRLLPKYGGIYDKILIEDERDYVLNYIPFYKTTNQNIFKPLKLEKKYDICIISNFSQLKYKGTNLIIEELGTNSKFLNNLKICHIGNKNEIGIELCKKYSVTNIDFLGYLNKEEINLMLNKSKFGLVASNRIDGCPRVITEILTSGTPLIIKEETRLLDYYKKFGVVQFKDFNLKDDKGNFSKQVFLAMNNYSTLKKELYDNMNRFDMNEICLKNINLWKK